MGRAPHPTIGKLPQGVCNSLVTRKVVSNVVLMDDPFDRFMQCVRENQDDWPRISRWEDSVLLHGHVNKCFNEMCQRLSLYVIR